MLIAICGGTGAVGRALTVALVRAGHRVVIGSRDLERAKAAVAEIGLDGVTPSENPAACAEAELVVIAVPWDGAEALARLCADDLAGKVVISMANALAKVGNEFDALVPPRGSVAAHVQAEIPRARVAAAFHHLPAKELANLDHPLEADVLVCSDHPKATAVTIELVGKMPGLRGLYLWYFRHVLPRIGRLVSRHAAAYEYLPASVGAFSSPSEFVIILRQHGFLDISAVPLTGGIVYLYTARRD